MTSFALDRLQQRQEVEAEIISTDDPKQLMRAQVRVFGLFDGVPDHKLPWATYKLPVGARPNNGDFRPAHVGDIVWVDFPYITHGREDTRRPRITGSVHFCPEGAPNLPHESWNGPDRLQHQRTGNEPVPGLSEYHESRVFTQHGITVEFEQPGCYRVTHRATGTAFEINDTGNTTLHSEANAYFSSKTKTEFEVGNQLTINVLQGDATVNVHSGNLSIKAAKNIIFEAGQHFIVRAKKFIEELG